MMVGKDVSDISVKVPEDAYDTGKHAPTFSAYLTAIVRDANGNIVKIHKQWSHSPTSNFINLLLPSNWYINTGQTTTITNTNSSSYTILGTNTSGCIHFYYPTSSCNNPTYLAMIQVGAGSQSNPYSAISLAVPISNGSGTGQLIYGTPSVDSYPTVSGSSIYFRISQAFYNISGGTVSITEIGILLNVTMWVSSTSSVKNIGNVLVWYYVLSSAISIPNGGSLTIYYTFTVNP